MRITRIFQLLLMVYAAAGLIVSLAAHLLAYAGIQPGGGVLFAALHVGIFPMWIPVVFLSRKLTKDAPGNDVWKTTMAGCPIWMRRMTSVFFVYALVNFAIFFCNAPKGKGGGGQPPPVVWRGFSGHWMVFYSVGLSVATAAYSRDSAD